MGNVFFVTTLWWQKSFPIYSSGFTLTRALVKLKTTYFFGHLQQTVSIHGDSTFQVFSCSGVEEVNKVI
jgi:hypothetical protein